MRILINDHAGHPFQVQLSRNLALRGHQVIHTFTADLQTPRGALQKRPDDPKNVNITPIALTRPFERYGLARRFMQERELGRQLQAVVCQFKPNVVMSANTPLGAQAMLQNTCLSSGAGFGFWLQDLLGVGIRNNLKKKLPVFGDWIGQYYMGQENRLLKKSRAVVVITEDFVPIVEKAGAGPSNIHVIHNWAPLHEVPVMDKHNDWSKIHGLDSTFNFIYSGTLGMKHNPGILVSLARAVRQFDHARVVVITEGLGAEYLAQQKARLGLENLLLFPFQPFEQIPQVQAAADVLMAILEPDAGVFAVPSKVLTYLCAKRPLLLAIPLENLAARTVERNNAGLLVAPHDMDGFVQAALTLMQDEKLRREMGANGRMYAETNFDIETITDQFEKIFQDMMI